MSFGKSFLWVFLFGLRPLLCVWFVVSLDETQVWLGDLRVVWLVCVLFGLLWFACISGPFWSLYKLAFYCLCSCKDRATVRHRPYSRKKNHRFLYGIVVVLLFGCLLYRCHTNPLVVQVIICLVHCWCLWTDQLITSRAVFWFVWFFSVFCFVVLIRWICEMQLSLRLDKRPSESYLALDGKNDLIANRTERERFSWPRQAGTTGQFWVRFWCLKI